MRKLIAVSATLVVSLFFVGEAWSLDPVAPRSFRSKGILWVKTPNPPADIITVTKLGSGKIVNVISDKTKIVPVGKYKVQVQMQDYRYSQTVLVEPTERTDVVVPGFGNLKINSPLQGNVEVFGKKSGQLVAKFPVNEIKTLPRGHYDVKIHFGKLSVTEPNVWVVTNTTRELDVIKNKNNKK